MASCSRQSLELVEVYRIIYQGREVNLRGVILSCEEENGFQFLFKPDYVDNNVTARDVARKYMVSADYLMEGNNELDTRKPFLKHNSHILLNGPTEASIGVQDGFSIEFHMFGDVHRFMNSSSPRGVPQAFAVPLKRTIESDDGNKIFTVLYAFFDNAVEAHVKVKLIDVNSNFGLHEIISVRTSARREAYSSILFFKKPCDKLIVGREKEMVLPLSRSLVGVSLGYTIFLDVHLSGDDNNSTVLERLPIDVDDDSTKEDYSKTICCINYAINVEIKWKFERKPKRQNQVEEKAESGE